MHCQDYDRSQLFGLTNNSKLISDFTVVNKRSSVYSEILRLRLWPVSQNKEARVRVKTGVETQCSPPCLPHFLQGISLLANPACDTGEV